MNTGPIKMWLAGRELVETWSFTKGTPNGLFNNDSQRLAVLCYIAHTLAGVLAEQHRIRMQLIELRRAVKPPKKKTKKTTKKD